MRNTGRGVAHAVARVLNTIGLAIVAVIVVHIVLVLLDANPENGFAVLVRQLAEFFNLGVSTLFLLPDPKVMVTVNYGVAALLWLLITSVVVRLVRRLG